jgi:hypothetical protein
LIAELDFRGTQLEARWTVTIGLRPVIFTIIDNNKKTRKTVATVGEVINIIGGFSKLGR